MHPLCCDTDVADRNTTPATAYDRNSTPATATNNTPLFKFLDMHPPSSPRRSAVESEITGGDEFHSARMYDVSERNGNGISGILYKWVNYGRGWRPRWFVLNDGVLSYYKINGRHKIVTNLETEKGSLIVGEKSFRRINTSRITTSEKSYRRKPFGEIHLKVCYIFYTNSLSLSRINQFFYLTLTGKVVWYVTTRSCI